MVWQVKFSNHALKALSKMDEQVKIQIMKHIKHKLANLENPRAYGKALTGEMSDFWRYRVGKYRIICHLEYTTVTILILAVDKRDKAYTSDLSYTLH